MQISNGLAPGDKEVIRHILISGWSSDSPRNQGKVAAVSAKADPAREIQISDATPGLD